MNNTVKPAAGDNAAASANASANSLLTDIRAKWSKFSEIHLNSLKSVDRLTALIAAKYPINQADARKEAEAVVSDRQF